MQLIQCQKGLKLCPTFNGNESCHIVCCNLIVDKILQYFI
jgi:hypothetical protein